MYGLIVENVLRFLRSTAHPKVFDDIRRSAQLPLEDVDILANYPENLVGKIVKKASMILQMADPEIMEGVGIAFVDFYQVLGYRQTVARIAREFREFILNLDNCHDYFKLTFPKMRAPSFFIEQEHENGAV
jgi:guanylate cyclase